LWLSSKGFCSGGRERVRRVGKSFFADGNRRGVGRWDRGHWGASASDSEIDLQMDRLQLSITYRLQDAPKFPKGAKKETELHLFL